MSIPPVGLLNAIAGPSAIAGFVITVYVDAVQRGGVWSFSHIAKEGHEIGTPRLADHDAAPTVVFVTSDLWIGASRKRSLPTVVGSSMKFGVSMSGLKLSGLQSGPRYFFAKATTRACLTRPEILRADRPALAAFTLNNPARLAMNSTIVLGCFGDDGKSAEFLTSKIPNESKHAPSYHAEHITYTADPIGKLAAR